jgi:acyl-coenzyme A synthetase/AMP-(fatty) acid ligase
MGIETTILEKFSVKTFLHNVQNESITHVYAVPPIVLYLASDPAMTREQLSSLRMVTSAAASLAPDLIRTVYDRLKVPVRQGFGLTESTGVSHVQVCMLHQNHLIVPQLNLFQQRWDRWGQAIGSTGPPFPHIEVKFIDEQGTPVSKGESELCMRGPTIFRGYHNNDEATARSITPDGWFKTGDIGLQDEDGNLFITDRLKDLIKYKGFQISPAEIESVLHGHPLVHDVAVIGLADQKIASEIPVAYVVIEETRKPTEQVAEELVAYVSGKLAPHKRLRGGIIPISEIPKSASGKIQKRVLRTRAEGVDQGKAIGATVYDDRSSKL